MPTAPYGAWESPISADLIVSGTIGLGQIVGDHGHVYWSEGRPSEGGRQTIVCRDPDGKSRDLLPPPWNARTRVHEYGGGAYLVHDGALIFANFADQRLYRTTEGSEPEALTPDGLRYADGVVDTASGRLICVREDHRGDGEARNTIVSIDLAAGGEGVVLSEGSDFCSTPRLDPSGRRLVWLRWDHPNMPWDGTELWVAELDGSGALRGPARVAGGVDESIFQPGWSPDGSLVFVSDRTGFWNLYRLPPGSDEAQALCAMEAEFGQPQWGLGFSTWDFESAEHILCAPQQRGSSGLCRLELASGTLEPIELGYPDVASVRVADGAALMLLRSPTRPTAVGRLDLGSGRLEVLREAADFSLDASSLSVPEPVEFPSAGRTAHAFWYAPVSRDHAAPVGERPPLIVVSHGGPTGAASPALNLAVQFWTSRGFGVVDVNYSGSTGYGREYRNRLRESWGIADLDDCTNAALWLADRGLVDRERLAIRGGSAGGYTTLCALTFRDAFRAGASYYGVSDLELLAQETHKFESRYLDRLVGPYPETRERYRERSPIHFTEQLACPLILLQGLDDPIVPPNQAEGMFDALRRKGVPVAYVPFEGEQHGFRRAENIKRALEAELYFYGRIFGFEPADRLEPVAIENLDEA